MSEKIEGSVTLPTQADLDNVLALIQRIDKGKPKPADLEALRRAFDQFPTLWRMSGDVLEIAARTIIDKNTTQATVRESMHRGLAEIKMQLGYDRAPGVERLLIEACALAWLRYGIAEYRYTQAMSKTVTLTQGDYYERQLTAAHRRYLHSLHTLAKVRRLAVPALQVNVAQPGARQLNVATGTGAS